MTYYNSKEVHPYPQNTHGRRLWWWFVLRCALYARRSFLKKFSQRKGISQTGIRPDHPRIVRSKLKGRSRWENSKFKVSSKLLENFQDVLSNIAFPSFDDIWPVD